MHCGSCVRRVSQALAATPGVTVNEVRVGAARLTATEDPAPVDRPLPRWPRPATRRIWNPNVGDAVAKPTIDLAQSPESLTLPVLGMTCASCQHHVEQALRATAGRGSRRAWI